MNLDRFNNMNNEPISYHWDLFIPPENDRKTRGFMFSGSVKRDQWNDLGQEKKQNVHWGYNENLYRHSYGSKFRKLDHHSFPYESEILLLVDYAGFDILGNSVLLWCDRYKIWILVWIRGTYYENRKPTPCTNYSRYVTAVVLLNIEAFLTLFSSVVLINVVSTEILSF